MVVLIFFLKFEKIILTNIYKRINYDLLLQQQQQKTKHKNKNEHKK